MEERYTRVEALVGLAVQWDSCAVCDYAYQQAGRTVVGAARQAGVCAL